MKRNTVERETQAGRGEERGGLHRPIVSPSTHKGRRRRGIIRLVWQELWLPAQRRVGSGSHAGGTNGGSGCSCHGNRLALMGRRGQERSPGGRQPGQHGEAQ